MSSTPPVKALRITNEAFLVASTIERCPKTMMLRELVMNALEAARDGQPPRLVEIRPVVIDGVRKLGIWNTGAGLSAAELDQICDLASTLRKQTGLDQNFGMGAKVASLPSNQHGMRFRSCSRGRVSEVMLGQRGGVYGRLPVAPGVQQVLDGVADVTQLCQAAGQDLSSDWTEVVLFGQTQQQDTVTAPYNGNPAMQPDWVMDTLTRRFFRLPAGLELRLAPGIGADTARRFTPLSGRWADFQRMESVTTESGVVLHYGFTPDPSRSALAGGGFIVYQDEIYGVTDGTSWLLDAPTFGFPFGARFCTVMVELPASFKVWPEVYRQFLRFREGDQRQVFLRDFANLIRANIPGWLQDIIASYGPRQIDHLGEIRGELTDLLKMLEVPPTWRGSKSVRGAEEEPKAEDKPETKDEETPQDEEAPQDKKDDIPDQPSPPKEPTYEQPPEIVALTDEAQIEERGLTGRAAAYFASSHQLFVNLRYPAVAGMQAQLRHSFDVVPDPERADAVAAEIAEWAVTRLVARRLVYTLSKNSLGWTDQEIASSQSPASFSLTADDYAALMPAARRRMAESLGLALPDAADQAGPSAAALKAQQIATSLAAARQAAQRAPTSNRAAPFLRRISELEMAQRNWPAAQEWAEKAVAANAADPWSHLHLAKVMFKQDDLEAAEAHARRGLALDNVHAASFETLLSEIARARNDLPAAIEWLQKATQSAPSNLWLRNSLSHLLQQSGDIAGSEAVVQQALAQTPQPPAFLLRRKSELALHRRDYDDALAWADKVVEAEPQQASSHSFLSTVFQRRQEWDAALRALQTAMELEPERPAPHLRAASNIALGQRDFATAAKLAAAAVEADPEDPRLHLHESHVHQAAGDIASAESSAQKALDLAQDNPSPFMRRMAEIAEVQARPVVALEWLKKALAADPKDPAPYDALARALLRQGDLDGAWQAATRALALQQSAGRLRRMSEIALKREGTEAAQDWAEKAIAADPNDPWSHHHLAGLLQQQGDLSGAVAAAKQALSLEAVSGYFKQRVDNLERQSQQKAA